MTFEREKEIRESLRRLNQLSPKAGRTVELLLAEIDRLRNRCSTGEEQLKKQRNELKEKLTVAEDFILWLTPCGQCEPVHSIDLIGKRAREIFSKIRGKK